MTNFVLINLTYHMANIILEIDETFQHEHDHVSLTKVVKGKIQFSMNNQNFTLESGQQILVPASTSHSLQNVGKVPAEVYCGHRVQDGTVY